MTTQNFPLLTVDFINNNIGKEITWFAYGDKSNFPYKGICIIKGLEKSGNYTRPVIEHIKGDELSFGYIQNDFITYSDNDRPVKLGNPFDLYRINMNGMYRDIVVPAGQDAREVAKRTIATDEFEIEHLV
jgi:hypothetical protein